MSDHNDDFGYTGASFAHGNVPIGVSDHDLIEAALTRKERAVKEEEIRKRRARLHDPFDLKYWHSQIQRYEQAYVAHRQMIEQAKAAGVSEDKWNSLQYAFHCPGCGRDVIESRAYQHLHGDHEEYKALDKASANAGGRFEYLMGRIKSNKEALRWHENHGTKSDRAYQNSKSDLASFESQLQEEFDAETRKLLRLHSPFFYFKEQGYSEEKDLLPPDKVTRF